MVGNSVSKSKTPLSYLIPQGRAGGALGPAAFSRFYDTQGVFSWAPCHVLHYDRCVFHIGSTIMALTALNEGC